MHGNSGWNVEIYFRYKRHFDVWSLFGYSELAFGRTCCRRASSLKRLWTWQPKLKNVQFCWEKSLLKVCKKPDLKGDWWQSWSRMLHLPPSLMASLEDGRSYRAPWVTSPSCSNHWRTPSGSGFSQLWPVGSLRLMTNVQSWHYLLGLVVLALGTRFRMLLLSMKIRWRQQSHWRNWLWTRLRALATSKMSCCGWGKQLMWQTVIVPPPPRSSLQRSSRQRKAVPSHWPLKRALPAGWLLFLSLVTGSSYTRLHFATLCACVMAGSHSLCHHSARVARRTPLAMHCPVQSAVTQPSGTMRWETSQPVCCGKYATTWQQSHLFSLWLVKPSLPALSSATTRLAWTSPRVAFGAVGSRKHFWCKGF